jgi:hypothetical protein
VSSSFSEAAFFVIKANVFIRIWLERGKRAVGWEDARQGFESMHWRMLLHLIRLPQDA